MRLEKIVEEVMPLHTEELRPVHLRIKVPIQENIEGIYPSKNKRSHTMGRFYEYVNHALYGGELNDLKFDVEWGNGELGDSAVKPDVVDDGKNVVWESKASHSGHTCNLTYSQLEGYMSLQYNSPETILFYSFYRHFLKGIKTQERTEKEIIEELIDGTAFSLVLPFSVIMGLRNISGQTRSLVRSYEGHKTWPDCLCIRSPTLNSFLVSPEQTLEDAGLNLPDFEIRRYLSPKNLSINQRRVDRFPVVRILDKDHEKWVERFQKEFEGEMEKINEDAEPLVLQDDGELPF